MSLGLRKKKKTCHLGLTREINKRLPLDNNCSDTCVSAGNNLCNPATSEDMITKGVKSISTPTTQKKLKGRGLNDCNPEETH